MLRRGGVVLLALAGAGALGFGCGGGGGEGDSPLLFAEDYAQSYSVVSDDCHQSTAHGLTYVRIFVNPKGAPAAQARTDPYPEGSVLLKEEYLDEGCTDLSSLAVMRKEMSSEEGDVKAWRFQRASPEGDVVQIEEQRCIDCHQACVAPDDFDNMCSIP